MKNDAIELVTQYKEGKELKEKSVTLFAERKSVTSNRFYSAYAVGLRPQHDFVIHKDEYNLANVITADGVLHNATHVRYGGQLYSIIRTYDSDMFNMEITV